MDPTLNNEISGNSVNPTLIVSSGGSIASDSDVAINYPLVDQQVLQYNGNTNKWINHVLTGTIPIGGLSNVLITNAQDSQTLLFNAGADEWENAFVPNPSLNNLTNCTIGSQGAITNPLVDQQVLRYSSSTGNWIIPMMTFTIQVIQMQRNQV